MLRCSLEEKEGTITEPGRTDLLFFHKKSGKMEKRLEMEDIIDEGSSCTLLASSAGRYHVGDQGLNQVYTIYMEEGKLQATECGSPEQWAEVSQLLEAVAIAAWEKSLVMASKGTLAMYRMEEL